MPKPKEMSKYHTVYDIAKLLNKQPSTIRHHVKRNNFPKPFIILTFVRFIGTFIRKNQIYFWNDRQIRLIQTRDKKISRGLYKGLKHPITGKKIKSKPPITPME